MNPLAPQNREPSSFTSPSPTTITGPINPNTLPKIPRTQTPLQLLRDSAGLDSASMEEEDIFYENLQRHFSHTRIRRLDEQVNTPDRRLLSRKRRCGGGKKAFGKQLQLQHNGGVSSRSRLQADDGFLEVHYLGSLLYHITCEETDTALLPLLLSPPGFLEYPSMLFI
jgi:hypothetical protein